MCAFEKHLRLTTSSISLILSFCIGILYIYIICFFFVHFYFYFCSTSAIKSVSFVFEHPIQTTHKYFHQFIWAKSRKFYAHSSRVATACYESCKYSLSLSHTHAHTSSAWAIFSFSFPCPSRWCLPIFFFLFALDSYLLYFIHVKKALELHTIDFVICIDERRMH